MKRLFIESISLSVLWVGISVLNPTIAFAQTSAPEAPSAVAVEAAEAELPAKFIATGDMVAVDKIGILIAPPKGWTVYTDNGSGPSLVFEEPKKKIRKRIRKKITTYQRNITVSIKHESAPIDEKQALVLTEQLSNQFSKQGIVSDYSVLEHKLFDYSETQKGLLVYASFNMSGISMMQMHVLVSSDEKQYLQTYTDMAKRFSPDDAGFNNAWNSMVSLQSTGKAPFRYQKILRFSAIACGLILLLLVAATLRRRKRRKYLENSVSDLENGDFDEYDSATTSANWATVDSNIEAVEDDLPVTNVSPLQDSWAVSNAPQFVTPKANSMMEPKVRVSDDSEEAGWVLPVKTRVSPTRFSSHA